MKPATTAAFILGAGLGTRLRPLTEVLPKPLVPVLNRPLITHAMDRLLEAGIGRFWVNTHHLPGAYADEFPEGAYRGCPIEFLHEPVLLDTGGALANAVDRLREPFLLYNGDIWSDMPMGPLIRAHRDTDAIATLALRSSGPACNVSFEAGPRPTEAGTVCDLRGLLCPGRPGTHQYTGVAVIEPALVHEISPGTIVSLIPLLSEAIRRGRRVAGLVMDGWDWVDLGTPREYMAVHRRLSGGAVVVSPGARVDGRARLGPDVVLGPNVVVEPDCDLLDVVAWVPGGDRSEPLRISRGTRLEHGVLFGSGHGRFLPVTHVG